MFSPETIFGSLLTARRILTVLLEARVLVRPTTKFEYLANHMNHVNTLNHVPEPQPPQVVVPYHQVLERSMDNIDVHINVCIESLFRLDLGTACADLLRVLARAVSIFSHVRGYWSSTEAFYKRICD